MNLVISKILKNGIPDFKKLIDPFIPPESLDELGNSKKFEFKNNSPILYIFL